MPFAIKRYRFVSPEFSEYVDLFFGTTPPVGKILVERFVFDGVPAGANTETQPSARYDVDACSLFCNQCCLTLRQNNDGSDEFECLGDPG